MNQNMFILIGLIMINIVKIFFKKSILSYINMINFISWAKILHNLYGLKDFEFCDKISSYYTYYVYMYSKILFEIIIEYTNLTIILYKYQFTPKASNINLPLTSYITPNFCNYQFRLLISRKILRSILNTN